VKLPVGRVAALNSLEAMIPKTRSVVAFRHLVEMQNVLPKSGCGVQKSGKIRKMDDGGSMSREACKHRENWLRLWAVVVGLVSGELLLTLLGNPWEFSRRRVFVGLTTAVAAYVISEVVIGIGLLEFFNHAHELDLRLRIRYFLENHREIDLAETAKIVLTLILADPRLNNLEMEIPFTHYLKFLAAATIVTQGEWFATLRLPLSEWSDISENCEEYFGALGRAQFSRKLRIFIGPIDEINNLNDETQVVRETRKVGSPLFCIPINNQLKRIKDYAIFDDTTVITAEPLGQKNSGSTLGLASDPYYSNTNPHSKWKVAFLRGPDNISKYKSDRDTLLALSKRSDCRKFPLEQDENGERTS
jgi:hypothetical protein